MMKLYTQKPKKYKQLQPEERGQIEAYYKMVSERKKKADERFRNNGHRRY